MRDMLKTRSRMHRVRHTPPRTTLPLRQTHSYHPSPSQNSIPVRLDEYQHLLKRQTNTVFLPLSSFPPRPSCPPGKRLELEADLSLHPAVRAGHQRRRDREAEGRQIHARWVSTGGEGSCAAGTRGDARGSAEGLLRRKVGRVPINPYTGCAIFFPLGLLLSRGPGSTQPYNPNPSPI